MKRVVLGATIVISVLLLAGPGSAEAEDKEPAAAPVKGKKGEKAVKSAPKAAPAKEKKAKKGAPKAKAAAAEGGSAEVEANVQENTLDNCLDGKDNDGDGYVDCDDQDCEIFAICVPRDVEPEPEPEPEPEVAEEPVAEPDYVPMWRPEYGYQCRDGKDNNADGLVDCHEKSCQSYRYCKKRMYVIPESPNRPQGFILSFGFGVATPNYRTPTATVDATLFTDTSVATYDDIPFDPDVGIIGDVKAGYAFLKWMGAGIDFKGALTWASNEREYMESYDSELDYKYTGNKDWFHVGAFVRFQWPFKRVVPYLDIAFGYSRARYEFRIYDPVNEWEDIREWDYEDLDDDFFNDIISDRATESAVYRHFTVGVEPGVDFYVINRRLALGVKAWLPIIAHQDSSTDNTGAMLTITTTPMWRERPRLKPEYEIDTENEEE